MSGNDEGNFVSDLRGTAMVPVDEVFAEQVRRKAILAFSPRRPIKAFNLPVWADRLLNFALVCNCVAQLWWSTSAAMSLYDNVPSASALLIAPSVGCERRAQAINTLVPPHDENTPREPSKRSLPPLSETVKVAASTPPPQLGAPNSDLAAQNFIARVLVPPLRPNGWAKRFEPENVLHAVEAAIEQTGATMDVRVFDCSEFPCIVWAEFDRTKTPKPLAFASLLSDDYDDDVVSLGGCDDSSSGRSYVRIAMRPKDAGAVGARMMLSRPSVRSALCPSPDPI